MSILRTSAIVCTGAVAAFAIATATAQTPRGPNSKPLVSVDLASEIDSVQGRILRMQMTTYEPGASNTAHSHKDRPALIYTVSGSITEYRSDCSAPIVHNAGDISREADGISHYWINQGSEPAVLLSSDVFHGK